MAGKRFHYIDVAKGLLMLMVVFGHIDGTATAMGYVNSSIDDIHSIVNIYVSFYMPCFFFITGYCSNFRKPFVTFLVSSIKGILIPSLFFSFTFSGVWHSPDKILVVIKQFILFGGGYWFLSALFVARLCYWCIYKCPQYIIIIINLIAFLSIFYLEKLSITKEYWWYIHAIGLMPYLWLGQFFKNNTLHNDLYKYKKYSIIIYVLAFVITIILSRNGILEKECFFDVPGITQGFININFSMMLPLAILSITGSFALIKISKMINSSRILEFIGRNSLVFYCVHIIVLNKSIKYTTHLCGGGILTLIILLLYFY